MELKNIKIDEDLWWELNKLKVEYKLKKLSHVIKIAVENYVNQKKKNEKKEKTRQTKQLI